MPQQEFQPVRPRAGKREAAPSIKTFRYAPGSGPKEGETHPGDFILTHGKGFFALLIRFGQRLRFSGKDAKFAWWSHAAMIVSEKGDLIEAVGAGVQEANLSKYRETEIHLVPIREIANAEDREQAVAFARWSLGENYGFMNILSIAITLLVGGKFSFGFDGQAICSGLVARSLERTDAIFNRSPSHIMPADLAKYFDVPKGVNRGKVPPPTARK